MPEDLLRALFGNVTEPIQSIGEWLRVLRYYPKKSRDKVADEKAWHDKVGDMLALDDYAAKYRIGYERLIVIKEACGISCVSFGLAIVLAAFRWAFDSGVLNPSWRSLPVTVLALVMVYALFRMHRAHVDRQSDYVDRVIDRGGKPGSDKR